MTANDSADNTTRANDCESIDRYDSKTSETEPPREARRISAMLRDRFAIGH